MGRRSAGAAAPKRGSLTSSSSMSKAATKNPVEQLRLLREFVSGTGGVKSWTEVELTDCLRQCGYNVERAAECLMTGQYTYRKPTVSADGRKKGKSAFFSMSTTTSSATSGSTAAKKKLLSAGKWRPMARIKSATSTATAAAVKPAPPSSSATTSTTASKPRAEIDLTMTDNVACKAGTNPENNDDDCDGRWLLCQRWISHAICTTRNAHTGYHERLELTHTKTGHPCIRFRGARIEGRLPDDLAALLAPVLRLQENDSVVDKRKTIPIISLEGETLMEDSRVVVGALVPISIRVYINDPRAFFQLFESESKETSLNMFFDNNANNNSNNNNGKAASKKKKKRLPIAEAAFGLLQWAEYGDVMEFEPPAEEEEGEEGGGKSKASQASQDDAGAEDDDEVALSENDFEDEASLAGSTAEGKKLDNSVSSNEWAMSLPEADDPVDLAKGITLRPYQRQALYWMMKREQGEETREELEKQLQLLSELASSDKKSSASIDAFRGKENKGKHIVCDCGPVLVSEEERKKSKTVDGQVNPVNHPLWKQRFLASPDMKESVLFYVNELIGVATHRPPAPPKPCSGGILADDMGLGKTVMLLSLILQSKAERIVVKEESALAADAPTATLIVAKLSLLSQWEEEIKTKTSLTYLVYYGQSGKPPSVEEINAVDVVITTYGTIQSKKPAIMGCHWLRVILDEAHCVRNENTLASKVCSKLLAEHRWCATGTVIQNSLDDVYGIMKFLQHEPWCFSSFWKAAISRPMTAPGSDDLDEEARREGLNTALDRVRRLLSPMMLRRTKDSVTKDGKPILILPPVETKVVKVELSETEREFYNAVLEKSLALFDGYVEAGTLSKSYFQVFSLLQRLRQVCDHISLTVRSRSNDSSNDGSRAEQEQSGEEGENDSLEKDFLEGLLEKFCVRQESSPKKRPDDEQGGEPAAKRPKEEPCLSQVSELYLSQVAEALTETVRTNSSHVEEECPICLELPKIEEAVLAPCAHIFCRKCLLGYLREKAPPMDEASSSGIFAKAVQCPDGECPVCNKAIDATRIVAFSKSKVNGGAMTTTFLPHLKAPAAAACKPSSSTMEANARGYNGPEARRILAQAVGGLVSSKMAAIMKELMNIWQVDPGSKAVIFSHYLGFLDLLGGHLEANGVTFFRLDGSLSLKERKAVLDQFRSAVATEPSDTTGVVLLISMAAGGEGLNLVEASSCFICDPWWNVAKEDQCVNRIHRIGQTASVVRVFKFLVEDSVEERIVELQSRKKFISDEIYNGAGSDGNSGGAKLSLDDFKLIFRK